MPSEAVAKGDTRPPAGVRRWRALQEREATVNRWLRTEVVSVHDRMLTDPDRALRAASVFDGIRARHAARSS